MENNNIDKVYNTLLTATPENNLKVYNEVKEVVDQIPDESIDMTNIDISTPVEGSGKQVISVYDPRTGNSIVPDDSINAIDAQLKNLDNFDTLCNDTESDLESDLRTFLKDYSSDIKTSDDVTKIAWLMANKISDNNIDYYSNMPEFMQQAVSQIMINTNTSGIPKNRILHKNQVAKMLINDYVEEYKKSAAKTVDLDTLFSGFTKDANDIANTMSHEIADLMLSFDDERKAQIDAAINKARESNNTKQVEMLTLIKDNIDNAFNLTEFKEFCKHCKIKNIEMKKPNRVYDSFIHKYETNDAVINDIRTCPDIIIRHLTEYTRNQAMMICLAYCKYCANMSPDNMVEHTFMYYFIRNIIAIDRINPRGKVYASIADKDKKFYDTFVANLRECMENLLERNVTFK